MSRTPRAWIAIGLGLAACLGRLDPGQLTAEDARPDPPADRDLVGRVFYGDPDRLAGLVSRYDVFGPADHEQGFVLARLRAAEWRALREAGFRLELEEALTAQANARWQLAPAAAGGIPNFPCYRTVEETEAAMAQMAREHPGLVALVDIGDSWEKAASGGIGGYDLQVLVLSNQERPGPKPRLFLLAEHHARELVTAETALRFAEELAGAYDQDPDVTWLLDYHELHVLPLANPDGRKWAEQGYWWRKNTANTNGCDRFPTYGTDLNRNCDFRWGGVGSSDDACSDLYRGPAPFSEPENQAIRDYARALFPDQRGPRPEDAAPADATGLLISLHSYGQMVLFPWGYTTTLAPNHTALAALGGKFGFFNRYVAMPSHRLYPTTGTLDEWVYAELGVAAYTFEMGNLFFEPCAVFEQQIYPSNRLALLYAAKACRQPYRHPAGPDVLEVAVAPQTSVAGTQVTLTAVADGRRSFGTSPALPARPITAARYSVNTPSWIAGAPTHPLAATDGAFGSAREEIRAILDTTNWAPGRHTVFVEAQTSSGEWGVPTAVFVSVAPLALTGAIRAGGFVLQWPSVAGAGYSVWRADALEAPFEMVATDVPASPPINTWTDTLSPNGTRLYQLRREW